MISYNVKDKVKRLILLLNKIRFEKKIKYLVDGLVLDFRELCGRKSK